MQPHGRSDIDGCRSYEFFGWLLLHMIVCSCNVISDHDVRATLSIGATAPRTTGEVYQCLGCSAQCGRCARTIRRIMNEALACEAPAEEQACCRDPGHCTYIEPSRR